MATFQHLPSARHTSDFFFLIFFTPFVPPSALEFLQELQFLQCFVNNRRHLETYFSSSLILQIFFLANSLPRYFRAGYRLRNEGQPHWELVKGYIFSNTHIHTCFMVVVWQIHMHWRSRARIPVHTTSLQQACHISSIDFDILVSCITSNFSLSYTH